MTVSHLVRYDTSTADLGAFLEHCRKKHVPIVARWPGIRRVTLASAAALEAALFAKERAEARLDFPNFPAFSGTVTHQAKQSEEAWRKP